MSAMAGTVHGLLERVEAREATCAHCGLKVPGGLVEPTAAEQFCCAGCRTAHAVIHSCGLDRYYELLSRSDDDASPARSSGRSFAEFDDEAFASLYVKPLAGGLRSVDLVLSGVHCGACVWLVEKLPRLAPGVIEARLQMRRAMVSLVWDPARVRLSSVARVLDSIGYTPAPARDERSRRVASRDDRTQLVRIGVAGACAGNVMLLAVCLYAGMFEGIERAHEQYFRWVSLGLTGVSLAWPGSVFFRSTWAALRTRTPHLDVPITLALVVGAVWSAYTTLRGMGEVYFDSLSVLVFVLLCGRYVQSRQQRSAADALEMLFSLTPTMARRVEVDKVREVAVESLRTGEVVEVRAGECFPADGSVVEGESRVDLSMMTGESEPVRAAPGDAVCAGAANLSSTLRVRVNATGEATRLGRLMRLVENGAQRRAPIVQVADRLSGWFVVGMLGLGAAALLGYLLIAPSVAVERAVALLVVTCPCALGLATPLTLTVALGRAARGGMLIKGGDAVQRLSRPGVLFLDKTGTLTIGRMSVVEWIGDEEARGLVSALEAESTHPVGKALHKDLRDGIERRIDGAVQLNGAGMHGLVDGTRVAAGTRRFVAADAPIDRALEAAADRLAGRGLTPVFIGVDGLVVAVAGLGDRVRPEAREAINSLRRMGWRVGVLSGDSPRVVQRVAAELGICDARGGLSPEDKVRIVEESERSAPTVFVGDGINDAGALATAGVGVAVHGGAEASLAAAGAYLTRPGIDGVVELVRGAERTMRVIYITLAASFVYNALAVAGTLMGFVTPLLAALIMPLSSITVLSIASVARSFDVDREKQTGAQA